MSDNTEKKWTEWSVVSTGDGTFRCKRTNVADAKDTEYVTLEYDGTRDQDRSRCGICGDHI